MSNEGGLLLRNLVLKERAGTNPAVVGHFVQSTEKNAHFIVEHSDPNTS